MGMIREYANRMNLAVMTPQGQRSSTGHVLASAESSNPEFLVYASAGGSFTVDLSRNGGQFAVEWLNATTGVKTLDEDVSGGASRKFTPPFAGDAVLYLKAKKTRRSQQ